MPAVIPGSVMKKSGRLILRVFPNERDFRRLIRVLPYLLHPSAEGFSIHLRGNFQIACSPRHWSRFLPFPESERTAALTPSHNVPELAQESKCEWHFEVPHVGIGVGNFRRFWSLRVLNDLPLTVKKVVNHLEEIHIVHPKNVSQLQPTPQFSYRKTNPTLLNLF